MINCYLLFLSFFPFDDAKLRRKSSGVKYFFVFLLKLYGHASLVWTNRAERSDFCPKKHKKKKKKEQNSFI